MDENTKLETPFIVFKGGGYDGCFWEWNIISFHKSGGGGKLKPTDVNVTGRAGNHVRNAFRESVLRGVRAATEEGEFEIVKTRGDWERFNADFNKGLVRSAARALNLDCKCDKCGGWCSADEIVHTGYQGDGGIGIRFDDNHCLECADELHDEWCAKNEWPRLTPKEKRAAIEHYNYDCGADLPLAAARRKKCPVSYRSYASEPEYY